MLTHIFGVRRPGAVLLQQAAVPLLSNNKAAPGRRTPKLVGKLSWAWFDVNTMGVTRRIVRAGGWHVAKRLIKPVPIIGSVFAFGLAGYEIKRKGLLPGAIHVGLDMTPVIGTAKNILEIFTGDLIPDKVVRRENGPNMRKMSDKL